MAVTPGSMGRRYAPFLAVAAVQVLLVTLAPSKPHNGVATLAGPQALASGAQSGTGPAGAGSSGEVSGGSGVGSGGSGAVPGGALGGGAGGNGPGTGLTPTSLGPAGTALDRSHCTPDGRQVGVTHYMPPCAPVWHGGDNGGASMTGVYPDHINYIFYAAKSDPQVNAVLGTQGLAASKTEQCAAWAAFDKELNKRWEFYGRKLISLDGPGANKGSTASGCDSHYPHFAGQCSLTPPDPPCERAEADVIAAMKPAYVMAPVADPAFYNELEKKGIIVAGGNSAQPPAPASYFAQYPGYYYDVVMDGTRAARLLAEYYCKKLDGKPPAFAGFDVQHPDGNPVGPEPKRKLAITFPATNGDPTAKYSADLFTKLVTGGMCGSGESVLEIPYQSDITTAQQQSQTSISQEKAAHVTTIVPFDDPIAPAFGTLAADQQNYHPEYIVPIVGLLDYDVLGRLYSKTQWQHAFGLSELTNPIPFAQSDAARAFADAGDSGLPDATENLAWGYFSLMGTSLQIAGPAITPANIRNALFRGHLIDDYAGSHDPHYYTIKFGSTPDDYTGIDDVREVWWSNTAISQIDGKPGAYIPVNNGQRYMPGAIPPGDPQVFK